jgi:hypothetical protein
MAETKFQKCAHPGCECLVAKGTKYCSPYCESRQRILHRLQLRAWGVCGQGDCGGSAVILNVQFFVTWIVTQLPWDGTNLHGLGGSGTERTRTSQLFVTTLHRGHSVPFPAGSF